MKPRANEALSRSKKLQARREVVERLADVWLQKSGLSSHKLRSQLDRTSTLNINNADCVVAVGTTEDTQNSLGRLATAKRQENAKEFEIREEESIDDMDVLPQYKPRSSSEVCVNLLCTSLLNGLIGVIQKFNSHLPRTCLGRNCNIELSEDTSTSIFHS